MTSVAPHTNAHTKLPSLDFLYPHNGPPDLYTSNSIAHYSRKKREKSHKFDTLLKWKSPPTKILIIKKINDFSCTIDLLKVALYLIETKKLNVYFEPATYNEILKLSSSSSSSRSKYASLALNVISYIDSLLFIQDLLNINIHFIIVLGGDGTLLYLVSLFNGHRDIPPIACFQRGSLGFLAPFKMKSYRQILDQILNINSLSSICIRMRLTARIWKHPNNIQDTCNGQNNCNVQDDDIKTPPPPVPPPNIMSPQSSYSAASNDGNNDNYLIQHDRDILFAKTQTMFPRHVCLSNSNTYTGMHALNEVLIHRNNNASMMTGNLYIDGDECTTIQADGMIFSTSTGSTAYNISAGGSLISPTVPCIALTPICPHTLSFRPVIVPDETIIHLQIPINARYPAIVSFDGRQPTLLNKGDVIEIIKCPYSVPTFKSQRFNVEWFTGLVEKFNWNKRELQKPIKK